MAAGDRLYDRMIILPESHYNKLMNEKQEHARFVESVNIFAGGLRKRNVVPALSKLLNIFTGGLKWEALCPLC